MKTIAALFVETGGVYFGLPSVDPWDERRDARSYAGPHPVICHPPCKRWGRYWHGSTRKPHQFRLGEDGGCFAAALTAVRNYGGVIEHPADSHAWAWFGIAKPRRGAGWVKADEFGGWTCYVEQGHYGHASRKPTWLYAKPEDPAELPDLIWAKADQRIPQWMIDRYGYAKARRCGVVAMIGGKDRERLRDRTPLPFRDVLLAIVRGASEVSPAVFSASAWVDHGPLFAEAA